MRGLFQMYSSLIRIIIITISFLSGVYLMVRDEEALGLLIIIATAILVYGYLMHRPKG